METKNRELKPSERISASFSIWLIALLAAMYPLGYYVSRYFIYGVPIFNEFISSSVAWGFLVPVYVFFVLAGSGLCLISSLGHIFKIGGFEILSRRAIFIAIVMLLTGFTAIAIDLGRIERAYIPFLVNQNFSSPMMWMMALYVIYFVFIIVEFWILTRFDIALKAKASSGLKSLFYTILTLGRRSISGSSQNTDHRIGKVVGIAALFLAIAAPTNLGAIFGTVKARPLWFGSFMPIFFILTAMISGAAILLLISIISFKRSKKEISYETKDVLTKLARVLGVLIVIDLIFIAWNTMTTAFSSVPHALEAQTLLISGPLAFQFWGLEIILGGLIPLAIIIYPKTRRSINGILAASLFAVIGIFFTRYDLIVAGQILPSLEAASGFYVPSQVELALFAGLVSMAALVYTVGQKIFPLSGH
jgi:molybdopterin-containing oxidoreductase family membrane subunit